MDVDNGLVEASDSQEAGFESMNIVTQPIDVSQLLLPPTRDFTDGTNLEGRFDAVADSQQNSQETFMEDDGPQKKKRKCFSFAK